MQKVTVTTAIELTAAEQKSIAAKLKKKFGASASTNFEVDPSILGGITLRINADYYDGSLSRKLEAIKDALYEQL